MTKKITIALLGKGGVGKTILATLIGSFFIQHQKKVLFIDADPARGLQTALDIEDLKTIGEARVEIIKAAKISTKTKEKSHLPDIIDYLLLEALYETPFFSLLVMGQTDTLGCYCPLNSLLRETIQTIGFEYDFIIIDAEAGIEQVNRQVVETVDYPIIVTDNSMRGVKTALRLEELIHKVPNMNPVEIGIIFNRVPEVSQDLLELIKPKLKFYGLVSADPQVAEFDLKGKSLLELPLQSTAVQEVRTILEPLLF